MNKLKFIIIIFTTCLFISACGNQQVSEAYKHLRLARSYIEFASEIKNFNSEPEKALAEYEKAYAISNAEFEYLDYKNMAQLYLEVRSDTKKYIEFDKKAHEERKEEEKSGTRTKGIHFTMYK